MRTATVLLLAIAVSACSSRAVYDSIQTNRRNECLQLPEAQYRECMENLDKKSYDEYERERQEYLKEREQE